MPCYIQTKSKLSFSAQPFHLTALLPILLDCICIALCLLKIDSHDLMADNFAV